MDYNELLYYIMKLGKDSIDKGVVPPEYEFTRLAYTHKEKVVIARVRGSEDVIVYANLFTSRKDIVRLLGAQSIEDLYKVIEESLHRRRALTTERFNDYFEEANIDFAKLPFIKFYREDGGFYLTSSVYIACYENICNESYHRTMLLDWKKAALRIVPRHLNHIINKFFEKGRDAPVALVLGLDPYHEIAAAMSPPLGVFEAEIGAGLGGYDKVVKTPLHGIPVPANSSIIVEGFISKNEKAVEGPFTDMLMLLDPAREQPVFIPERFYISKRKPPVVHAIVPGLWEHQLLMGLPREAHIYTEVKRVAPCVKAVRLTEGGSTWLHAIIVVDRACSEADAKLAALAAITAHPSIKHVLVVDDDVDIDNPLMIEWAVATRLKAGEDIIVIREVRGSTLEPRGRDGVGDKAIFLAIAPRREPWGKYRRVEIP